MIKKTHVVILGLFFLLGLISVLYFRLKQVKKAEKIPFFADKPSFVSQPPADALTGKILSIKGKLEKEPRGKDELEQIDKTSDILQGERLVSKENSEAEVEFAHFAKINIGSSSEINFVSLLPENFLVEQKSGEASYLLLQDDKPLSVRSLNTLLTLESGQGMVIIKGDQIAVEVLQGKAKLAMVDLENKTHVWQLEKNQKAVIDNTARTVKIEE